MARLIPAFIVVAALLAAGCVAPGLTTNTTTPETSAGGFTQTAVFPGEYKLDGKLSSVLTPGPFAIGTPALETLASKIGGGDIQVGYVLPDVPAGTKVPVIVMASPYFFVGVSPAKFVKESAYARLAENFVPHGYAVAFIPVRGTADTGGCMDLMGPAERSDLNQAITWLGEQEWSNGNVGMIGVSYDGSTPWEVAGAGNPYLKTIVPISGVNDIYDLMYGRGIAEIRGLAVLNALYYAYGFNDYNAVDGTRSAPHMIEGLACPESLKGLAITPYSQLSGERDPLGFWAARNSRPLVEANYEGSIFLVHGLQDWNVDPHHDFPWVPSLEEKGLKIKYLLSQTDHAWPDGARNDIEKAGARMDWAEMLLHWFDSELKGLNVDIGPRVQVQDSAGEWRIEQDWPPQDASWTGYHIGAGKLGPDVTGSGTANVGTSQTGFLDFGPSFSVEYATEALEQELRFAGLPRVRGNATPTGPGGMLSVELYDVDGSKMTLVGWGAVDLRYPKGGEAMSLVVPGQPIAFDFPLEPLDVVVPPGHKLVAIFHVDGYSDHPGILPTPIQLDEKTTILDLPVIERDDPTAFFTPPQPK